MMKCKWVSKAFIFSGIMLILTGCGKNEGTNGEAKSIEAAGMQEEASPAITYQDALGEVIEFTEQEIREIRSGDMKTAVLNGSLAEIWSLADGKLAAVTVDAYDDSRDITFTEETVNAGALKSPSQEVLIEERIRLAFLSVDIEEHVAMRDKLEEVGIKTVYHSVETFEDYLAVLKLYTEITGCIDRYETYGERVRELIDAQLARQDGSRPEVLFIRAFSTGAKAKGSDNMTGIMLKELGCSNIADREQSLTDDLSMEVILEKDPDYIFVTTMGIDDGAALKSVETLLEEHPAWNTLHAVKNKHYHVLPKNMFHNKPNQRWGESYKMLADILYPESISDTVNMPDDISKEENRTITG